jgi:serine/threonine protein kinase
MEADLHQIIRSGQDLSSDHIAYFTHQILSAMKFVHGCKVMHRDLKPGNILVNATCEIRICDFGTSVSFMPVCPDLSCQVWLEDMINPYMMARKRPLP